MEYDQFFFPDIDYYSVSKSSLKKEPMVVSTGIVLHHIASERRSIESQKVCIEEKSEMYIKCFLTVS